MSDDAFHLTPLDVRRFEFPAALRGYDRARVDAFRTQVADELERLTRQIQELDSRAKGFHEQLRAFRERDKALNEALVSAQQLRGDLKQQAEREAELILREARAQAEQIVGEARGKAKEISAGMQSIEKSRRTYLTQLKVLTERQLAELEAALSAAFGGNAASDGAEAGAPHSTPDWLKSITDPE